MNVLGGGEGNREGFVFDSYLLKVELFINFILKIWVWKCLVLKWCFIFIIELSVYIVSSLCWMLKFLGWLGDDDRDFFDFEFEVISK